MSYVNAVNIKRLFDQDSCFHSYKVEDRLGGLDLGYL